MGRHSIRNGWRPLTAGGSPSESPRSESPGHRALTFIGRHVRTPTMNWHHREPTLDEILSDSIVRAVMEVDGVNPRSEEHTSELQSLRHLVCRLLLEKKKNTSRIIQ